MAAAENASSTKRASAASRTPKAAKSASPGKAKASPSPEQLAAMQEGRDNGRKVRAYLDQLQKAPKPQRGRQPDLEKKKARAEELPQLIEDEDDVIRKMMFIQELEDISSLLGPATNGEVVDVEELRKEFLAAAKPYGENKGISYDTWRKMGVDVKTLAEAGITK